jgi:hypothetical protein
MQRKKIWLEFICEFDFDIKHIKGKENKVVDAFNIRIYAVHATTNDICKSNLTNRILDIVSQMITILKSKKDCNKKIYN